MREEIKDCGTVEYRKSFNPSKALPFQITFCGYSFCSPTYHISRGVTSYYTIEYIVSGSGYVRENDIISQPCAGDTHVFHPGSFQTLYCNSNDPWEKIWIIFFGEIADSLFKAYNISERLLYKGLNTKKELQEIIRICIDPNLEDYEKMSKCSVVFFNIIQKMYMHNLHNESKLQHTSIAERFKILIDQTEDYSINLSNLTKQLNVSRDYAIRLFTEKFDISPYKYMTQQRIKKICRMLSTSTIPICEISDNMGFCDQGYFSTWFKQHCGMSPRDYRKNVLKDS